MPLDEAGMIVERMNIIHPFGTLGKLNDLNVVNGHWTSFGFEVDFHTPLEQIADNIITYTQQTHEKATLLRIHNAISINRVLVFLGFGFNNQNLDLLRVKALDPPYNLEPRNIFTTGVGTARQVSNTLIRRILDIFVDVAEHDAWKDRVHIEFDQTCIDLFYTHQMNLSSFTQSYFTDADQVSYQRYRAEEEEAQSTPLSYRYTQAQ
jgi:hypothetical protein